LRVRRIINLETRRKEHDMPNVQTSPRMEHILIRAAEIGRAHTGQAFVGTENVLRAMIEDDGGIAAKVLKELGVAERVAARLDEIMASESYRTPSTKVHPTPPPHQ
jgi:ATP-dependent Clp protease ATP-binding subunit ClpA